MKRLLKPVTLMLVAMVLFAGADSLASSQQEPRAVFAHYMLTNQDYVADRDDNQEEKIAGYEREIREARALGIDGFALNAGGWLHDTRYICYAAQMFEAAARLREKEGSGFTLMFSADMCCGNSAADVEDMMRRFAGDPRYANVYFKRDGKFVLTTFSGDAHGTGFWKKVRADLATGAHPSRSLQPEALASVSGAPGSKPLQIFFVPSFFWGGELPRKEMIEQHLPEWKPIVDGLFYWGIAGVPGEGGALDQLLTSADYADAAHGAGKLYMAPVALQFWGANADRYYEYSGLEGMQRMWGSAIASGADWVEIITWNDFIEGTYIVPIDDIGRYRDANVLRLPAVPRGTLGYFHSHAAAAEMMKYFIGWYKSGKTPAIDDDSVYWAYRTQSAQSRALEPSVQRRYGPVEDDIYIAYFLTAPATLRVRTGTLTQVVALPAGAGDVRVPFEVGYTPSFEMLRDGKSVISGQGLDQIEARPRRNDFYYSTGVMHGPARASDGGHTSLPVQ